MGLEKVMGRDSPVEQVMVRSALSGWNIPGGLNQDFEIGGDMNMLLKYAELTGQKVAKKTKDTLRLN